MNRITAVPVIDDSGRVINVYCRTDVMYLTRVKNNYRKHLDLSVAEELRACPVPLPVRCSGPYVVPCECKHLC